MSTIFSNIIAKEIQARIAFKTAFGVLLVLMFFAPAHSFADDTSSSKTSLKLKKHHWRIITFAEASPSGANKFPSFSVRPDDGTKGLCLDIDFRDPECTKPNMISARLYRENGEIVDSVGGNLNAPVPEISTMNPYVPGGPVPPPTGWTAQTSFPWGKNNLDESWIEVSMDQERYWLEIPYGYDRNPEDPLPPAITEKLPPFAAPIKKSTDHDHIVPWEQVCYDVLPFQDGNSISLNLSNPGDGVGEVILCLGTRALDLHTPRTVLKAIDEDGTEIDSTCTSIRLDEDLQYGRDDTFSICRYPYYERCWGQIEVKVDAKSYYTVVPSSMYEFGQGHPASLDLAAGKLPQKLPQLLPSPPDTSHADSEASKSAMIKMSSIIIQKVVLDKANMPTVIDFLTKKSKEFDPEHIGVRFVLESPPLPVETPARWPAGDLTSDRRPLVSINLPEMPLEYLMNEITTDTDLRYKFVNGVVVLYPAETEEQRRVNKAVVLKKLRSIILPMVDLQKADIFQVLDFLNDKSKELDPDRVGINFQAYVPFEKTTPQFTREVSMKLNEVPLNDILSFINKQTNLEYTITSKGVFFTEPSPE